MGGLNGTFNKDYKKPAILVLLILIIVLLLFGIGRKKGATGTNEETTGVASSSNAVQETESTIKDLETEQGAEQGEETSAETGLSEDLIEQLREKQRVEGVTPEDNAKAWESGVKDSVQATETAQEDGSDGLSGESASTIENGQETASDASGDKSNGRNFTTKDPKKPTMNSNGELDKPVADKVKDSMKPGSGPTIIENSSDTMKLGYDIKDYYDSTDGRGAVGDTLLLGKIGVKVKPKLSENGYTVSTSNDTAVLNFGDKGVVVITKVSDFDVTGLSLNQVASLGGITELSEVDTRRPTGGTYTSYSYLAVSEDNGVAIQYYSCPFGTYQFYYTSGEAPIKLAVMLSLNVLPDETVNSVENVEKLK